MLAGILALQKPIERQKIGQIQGCFGLQSSSKLKSTLSKTKRSNLLFCVKYLLTERPQIHRFR